MDFFFFFLAVKAGQGKEPQCCYSHVGGIKAGEGSPLKSSRLGVEATSETQPSCRY